MDKDADGARFPALEHSTTADVCIIGAGIAGISIAHALVREGRSVIVLEAGEPLNDGETIRTTAHLSNANDDYYVTLERLHGPEGARLAAESHTAAIDRIEEIVLQDGVECGFSRLDGYLFAAPSEPAEFLQQELAAAHRAGLTSTYMLERSVFSTFETGPSICFPRQAQFNVAPYVRHLLRAIGQHGGRIFAKTAVVSVSGGKKVCITTDNGAEITAAAAIVATHSPINDNVVMHTKMSSYRSYVIAVRIPHASVGHALYWDTADPYHYMRVYSGAESGEDGDLLIVGGEDHKTGQSNNAPERWGRLEAWTRDRFSQTGSVDYRWSGQIQESIDGLAFIGRNPLDSENVFIVTGDSGHGITHAMIASMLIPDLIAGRANPWETLYAPTRKSLGAARQFARENLNVAAQYADYLFDGSARNADEIPPGKGATLRRGLKRIAAYRDADGTIHECSAVCPHLGCIVHWNDAEHTWDCPCHGSRFNETGRVIHGPAVESLAANPEASPVLSKT